MWHVETTPLTSRPGQQCRLFDGEQPLRYADVLDLWQRDGAFRSYFNTLLTDVPYGAYRWETPAVTRATVGRPFEFVVLDCPGLERPADRQAFAEHFQAGSSCVAFANLGGDARLVVPCPVGADDAYGHLAAFVRLAPSEQRDALWQLVGQTMHAQLSERSLWLSTAGMGVAWLHVRLDARPKYYGHRPYQQAA